MNQGLPKTCLAEEEKSTSIYHYNSTHKVVTIIHSDKCLEYQSILEGCKLNCRENGVKLRRKREEKGIDLINYKAKINI